MAPKTDKKWNCKLCDKTFAHKQSLNNHMLRNHRENALNCGKCEKVFKSKFALKRHIEKERCKSVSALDCPVCLVKFTRTGSLKRHMDTQHSSSRKKKTFHCSHCQTICLSLAALREHEKTHIVKISTKKRFSKTYDVNRHDLDLALGENYTFDYGHLEDDDFGNLSMVSGMETSFQTPPRKVCLYFMTYHF